MQDKEKLERLKNKYGNDLLNTNGLFHLSDKNHNEIYINKETGQIDTRSKYRTISVLSNTVLCEVLNNNLKYSHVILNKDTLKCLYGTNKEINYLTKYIMYELSIKDSTLKIISHTGNILGEFENVKGIDSISSSIIIVYSNDSFNDKVLEFIYSKDKLLNHTENKSYSIYKESDADKTISILDTSGMRYEYSFITNKCKNIFTDKEEKINIWNI